MKIIHVLFSTFGIKCVRCGHQVSANDWVRRAGNGIYHLNCFACFFCKRQLSTGEEFGLMENQVLCRIHYDIMLNLQPMSDNGNFCSHFISYITPTEKDIKTISCILSSKNIKHEAIITTGNDLYGVIQNLPKLPKRPRTSFTSEQLQVQMLFFYLW